MPPLPTTGWLQSATRSLSVPGLAQPQLAMDHIHGTACEKLRGVSSHLGALSCAPSPRIQLPTSPWIAVSW